MICNLLQANDIGDSLGETVCYFGSCTPAAAPGTHLADRDVGREREQGTRKRALQR